MVATESLGDNHLCTCVVWSPQVSMLRLLQTLPGAWDFKDIWMYDLCIPAVAMTMYSETSVSGKSWPC